MKPTLEVIFIGGVSPGGVFDARWDPEPEHRQSDASAREQTVLCCFTARKGVLMCEFCTQHGEGQKWYLTMRNYSRESLS